MDYLTKQAIRWLEQSLIETDSKDKMSSIKAAMKRLDARMKLLNQEGA